jgi:DUF1365 family protein
VSRRSSITVGRVRHRRHAPRRHELSYGVYHVVLDLDELDDLDREVTGLGVDRWAVASFRSRDHLGRDDRPVREKLARLLADHGVDLPAGRVLLHTNLRVLGHVFNPVSWYLCHDADGELALVVAEVSNTFGEAYAYVLDDLERTGPHRVESRRPKRFHVSPFLDIPEHEYRFVIRPLPHDPADGDRFAVHMDVLRDGERVLDATNAEVRRELTTATLWWALLRYPLVTLVTVAAIHLEALRLWLKRVPFFRKPAPPEGSWRPSRRRAPRPATPATDPDSPLGTRDDLEHAS